MKGRMKSIVAYGLILSIGTTMCYVPADAEQLISEKKEYIILADNQSDCMEVLEGTVEENQKIGNLGNQSLVIVELTQEEAAQLNGAEGVSCVEENISFLGSTISDDEVVGEMQEAYLQSDEWNLDVLGVNDSKEEQQKIPTASYKDIKIAVMDSGVAVTDDLSIKEHVNLIDNEEANVFFEDTTGHGTSVASVIVAQSNGQGVSGINPDAEVYSVKVLDDCNSSDLYTVVSGIYWCINNEMDIINMSFGTNCYSKILDMAVQDAADAGILMVAAAGNSNINQQDQSAIDYPAALEQVLAVGSSTEKGTVSYTSSLGKELELFAPGEEVPATGIFEDIVCVNGSSMSAPHVTGLASILWAKDTSKTSGFIRGLLNYSAKCLNGDSNFGNGIPDLDYALDHYDEFSDIYTEGVAFTVGNNADRVQDYTENRIYASWSSANHSTLINNQASGTAANIMAIAAKNTDSNTTLKGDKKFHGGGNYVLNLKYLYRVADMMRENPDTSAVTLASILKESNINSDILTDHEKSGLSKLKNDLETVLRQEESGSKLVTLCGANTRKEKAYMIMGIACHLATDVYAHRVVIETGKIEGERLGNIKQFISDAKYKTLQGAINKYRVEFRDLKQYAGNEDNKKKIAQNFEDNIDVYPTRYSVASKAAIHGLYDCFITNKIAFGKGSTVITKVFANSSFSHKINNLTLYAGADNTVSAGISNKSTDVYRYDSMSMPGQNENDYDKSDYHYSDGDKTYRNSSLQRYS